MKVKHLFACFGLVFACVCSAQADDNARLKRVWDQEEAVARVQCVLDTEAAGQPWNDIAWETNVAKAVERSNKENKPLFVYIFLKKKVGPVAAPC